MQTKTWRVCHICVPDLALLIGDFRAIEKLPPKKYCRIKLSFSNNVLFHMPSNIPNGLQGSTRHENSRDRSGALLANDARGGRTELKKEQLE